MVRHMAAQVAVIVNDMAVVGIDAEVVRGGQTTIQKSRDRIVELSNGCICCTLRDDLLQVSRCPRCSHCAISTSLRCERRRMKHMQMQGATPGSM